MDDFLPPDPNSIFFQDSKKYYGQNTNIPSFPSLAPTQTPQTEFTTPIPSLTNTINPQSINQRRLEATPNTPLALILSVLGLVFTLCWIKWYGTVIGMLLACVSIYLANSGTHMQKTSPNIFSAQGLGQLSTAKILAYVTLGLVAISFIALIVYFNYVTETINNY